MRRVMPGRKFAQALLPATADEKLGAHPVVTVQMIDGRQVTPPAPRIVANDQRLPVTVQKHP